MSTPTEPAPLDAYLTAKPYEPTFTLQGGDPMAPLLVELWILGARGLTGLLPEPSGFTDRWIEMQEANQIEDSAKAKAMLIRATAAEEVLWAMQEYQKHGTSLAAEEAKPSGENSADEKARLDVYDLRRRCADRINTLRGAIAEYRDDLVAKGYITSGDELDNSIEGLMRSAKTISDRIDVRRGNASD